MMRFLLVLSFCWSITAFGQLNMSQLGHLDLVQTHSSDGSDIWGYVDGSGNEYAIMGLNDGTSIVDVTVPSNPVEVFYEPGMNSIWRDMKTFGDYAYVTTEAQNGLLIIDLSSLPNASGITTTYYTGPSGDEWESAHNLYIDENGVCYIFGANRDVGGCIMLDVATNPTAPIELGKVETWYSHDGVAQGDTLYMGHINDGFMSMYDVSDKANPVLLGTQNTPGNFSHNIWFSDNNNYVFTTDEISNGFIGAYDVTDPLNIIELDKIQSSPGDNVIPHNTHFINDYIVTSYYRDGVTIHDVSNPANLIEVGNFDSSPLNGDGFNGCWGVYPWFPSGNIIISDIESGLYILGANYVRGCYLEGQITDATTTAPISNATIEILTAGQSDFSNLAGNYESGIATAGTYTVEVSKFGYMTETVTGVVLSNGNVTNLDVQLTALPSYDITGTIDDGISSGVSNVMVQVSSPDTTYNVTTDGNGEYLIEDVIDGTYDIVVGQWGLVTQCSTITVAGASVNLDFTLAIGHYDDFSLDFGWTVSGNAPKGIWVREDPIGTNFGGGGSGTLSNPEDDATGECGEIAFITGNGGGSAGFDDVDDGQTILTSPVFDGTIYNNPSIEFETWWLNAGGSSAGDDSLIVELTNGTTTVELLVLTSNFTNQSSWQNNIIYWWPLITSTSTMQLIVKTADWSSGNGHLVEAGLDHFLINTNLSVGENHLSSVEVYPNPFDDKINIELEIGDSNALGLLRDISGKLIQEFTLSNGKNLIAMPVGLKKGTYLLEIKTANSSKTIKLIK
jgi:choice-of-anchor B domain-containing protein